MSRPAMKPMRAHSASPASIASAMTPAVGSAAAPAPSIDVMIHAMRSEHWLAVAMMARFSPLEMSGMAIARARMPSSGSWNIIDCAVPAVRKRPGSATAKATSSAARSASMPTVAPGEPRRTRPMSASRPWREASAMAALQLHVAALRPALRPARQRGDRGRHEDDQPDDDLEEVRRDAEEVEAVLQDGEEEDAEEHGGENVQLAADHGVGHRFADAVRLHEAGDAGHEAEVAVGQEMHRRHVHAEPPRRLGVA